MPRIIFIVALVVSFFGPTTALAAIVYENALGLGEVEAWYSTGVPTEIGDEITLSGTERNIKEFRFSYRGDFLDHGLDGDH